MKLTGDLEKKVNAAADQAEAKELIEQAGMLLTDDELAKVAGGLNVIVLTYVEFDSECSVGNGQHDWSRSQLDFDKFQIPYHREDIRICCKCGCVCSVLRKL